MSCPCCNDARDWPGTVIGRRYVENCLFCGARYIRLIPTMPVSRTEAADWRRRVLATWMAAGHSEDELRRLAKLEELPLAPALSSGERRKSGG